MALETSLCHIFGFLDHLQSENDSQFIAKAVQQCTDSQVIQWISHSHYHPQASGIFECWNSVFQNQPPKISDSTSLIAYWPSNVIKQFGHLLCG